ncbi:MAG: hypothetical protein IPM95_14440 [Sphingobacteriales bacterium]|nr:hypothetical protein [Sphingobacteriales bacterium]
MIAKFDASERGRTTIECDGEFEFNNVRNTDYCFALKEGYSSNDKVCATTKGVVTGGKVFVKIPYNQEKEYAMSALVLG